MAAPGCVGCAGPWYLKGFTGLATPHVDDIFTQPFKFNDFVVEHKDIKSSPLFGMGIGTAISGKPSAPNRPAHRT
ncbi:MAG TPA: hypothetical protein DDW26_06940 [Rhizobiales bacterium]|nr:hypothetical protein [Hyphomicrobiales bacterium]